MWWALFRNIVVCCHSVLNKLDTSTNGIRSLNPVDPSVSLSNYHILEISNLFGYLMMEFIFVFVDVVNAADNKQRDKTMNAMKININP